MKADNRELSCDVCGRGAGGGLDGGHFSYCSSCRKFACEICWLPEKDMCRACLLPGRVAGQGLQARTSETSNSSKMDMARPPTTRCERCGVATMMQERSTEFCLACGLLVCAACWREQEHRCVACAVPHQRPSWRGDLDAVRRWDRRLREVIRGVALLEAGATISDQVIDLRREHASLVLKSDGADRAGRVALARLPPASRTLRHEFLLRRISRHELLAHDSLERVSAMFPGLEAVGVRMAADAQSAKSRASAGERLLVGQVLMVAVSVVAIVILAQGWLDQLPFDGSRVGEDVLGGAPTGEAGDAATNIDPSQGARPSPAAVPTASPATIQFDFNTVRMGGGIGEGWVQSNGNDAAVAVAANPSAVDRSARLVAAQDATLETCWSVDPPMAQVHRFRMDVVLDPEMPATASIGLRDAAGDSLLRVDLAETQVALSSSGGESVTMAEGLEPGTWYSVEVVGDRVLALRVRPRDGPSVSGVEMPTEWGSLHPVGEICLGADGPPDAAVNYDNLVITNE